MGSRKGINRYEIIFSVCLVLSIEFQSLIFTSLPLQHFSSHLNGRVYTAKPAETLERVAAMIEFLKSRSTTSNPK